MTATNLTSDTGYVPPVSGTKTKADALFQNAFKAADANGDGSLNAQEFSTFQAALSQKIGDKGTPPKLDFAQLDKDGNGEISKSELRSGFKGMGNQLFKKADADGDGFLNQTEFAAYQSMLSQKLGDKAPPALDFSKLDTNGDGKISLSELQAAHRGHGHHHHAAKAPDIADLDGTSTTVQSTTKIAISKMVASSTEQQTTQGLGFDNLVQSLTTPDASELGS